jgi:hypothetical protein
VFILKYIKLMRSLIILGLFICSCVNGQSDSCILINFGSYKVTFFPSEYKFQNKEGTKVIYCYEIPFGKEANSRPWTPPILEIKDFEKQIPVIIENYKKSRDLDSSQIEDLNYITQNLLNYNRQYFCCKNKEGERILYINFSIRIEGDNLNKPDRDLIMIYGGGARYFNITYNYDLKKITSFWVNAPM